MEDVAGKSVQEEVLLSTEGEVAAAISTHKRSSFAGDMLRLVSGTAFAQIIVLIATPVITRLFAPEAFGIAAAVTSLVSIVVVVLFLRYDQAIVLPSNDHDAAALFGASIAIGSIVSLLFGIILWLWGDQLFALLRMQDLTPLKWLILVIVLVNVWYSPLSYWNTRRRAFGLISSGLMVNSASTSALRIGIGFAAYATSWTMVVADFFGTLTTTIFMGWQTFRSSGALFRQSFNPKSVLAMIQRYQDQPRYGTGAILLNTISWQLPVFVLTAFFSPAVAGQYALGQRIIRMPMSLFGNSIAKVFLARAATAQYDGTLSVLTRSIFRQLVLFGIAPTLFLLFEADNFFTILFGAQWGTAGEYVQILALWSFVWFISSPLAQLQVVLEKQRFFLVWTSLNLVSRFASLWIGAMLGDIHLALLLFGVSGVILYGWLVLYLMYCADVPPSRTLLDLAIPGAIYIPAILVIVAGKMLGASPWLQIAIATIVLSATFFITVRKEPAVLQVLGRSAKSSIGSTTSESST